MPQTIQKRTERSGKKAAVLNCGARSSTRKKNPWRTYGAFKDDPDFENAVRLGREYREQQTYEKELAGS